MPDLAYMPSCINSSIRCEFDRNALPRRGRGPTLEKVLVLYTSSFTGEAILAQMGRSSSDYKRSQ